MLPSKPLDEALARMDIAAIVGSDPYRSRRMSGDILIPKLEYTEFRTGDSNDLFSQTLYFDGGGILYLCVLCVRLYPITNPMESMGSIVNCSHCSVYMVYDSCMLNDERRRCMMYGV